MAIVHRIMGKIHPRWNYWAHQKNTRLVQVCVYTTKDANQRDEDMQKWTEALQERRYFVCANIDYLSSETYDKVEQKSYQYINGDDDYICRGSAFISPDNFKWRFGGWEEKND